MLGKDRCVYPTDDLDRLRSRSDGSRPAPQTVVLSVEKHEWNAAPNGTYVTLTEIAGCRFGTDAHGDINRSSVERAASLSPCRTWDLL
jgi:hypothetical protein